VVRIAMARQLMGPGAERTRRGRVPFMWSARTSSSARPQCGPWSGSPFWSAQWCA